MVEKYYMTWEKLIERMEPIDKKENVVYGIPRGGMICSAFLRNAKVTYNPGDANILIDDIIDSGRTQIKWVKNFPNKQFFGLVDKTNNEEDKKLGWIVFPWENDKNSDIDDNIIRLIQHYGLQVTEENITRIKYILEAWSK